MGRRRTGGVALAVLVAASCTTPLGAGSLGTLRYGGRVKGATPLAVLPPVTDPAGNVYLLEGELGRAETHAYVGIAGGGWNAECSLTKGDVYGAHGWVGFGQSRQWYWSGGALVSVSGTDGRCHAVLDHDPSTNADLLFQGVMPAVRNRTERTSLVAVVQSPGDPRPFTALVDLDAEFLTNVQEFDPSDAQDVQVIGVGGQRVEERSLVLVQYRQGTAQRLEARTYDGDANLLALVDVAGGPLAPYAVEGYLQFGAGGLVAGLVDGADAKAPKRLLTLDDGGGDLVAISAMTPVGVHAWDGTLWLVGTSDNRPVIARIHRSGTDAPIPWDASVATANALGTLIVRDDRTLPARDVTWTNVRSATGAFPFLSAHGLVQHAPSTTLWAFAGPTDSQGSLQRTAVAVAPVGVSYP